MRPILPVRLIFSSLFILSSLCVLWATAPHITGMLYRVGTAHRPALRIAPVIHVSGGLPRHSSLEVRALSSRSSAISSQGPSLGLPSSLQTQPWAGVVLLGCTAAAASFFWHRQGVRSTSAHHSVALGNHYTTFSSTLLKAQTDDGIGVNPLEGGAALELRTQLARLSDQWKGQGGDMAWQEIEGSYVLMPPVVPWGIIHFIGGAVLGTYPHVVYNELFMRVCRTAGVAVIATPYDVGLDHGRLSTIAGTSFKTTLEACRARYGWSPEMPVFALGHSLGAKLQVLLNCTAIKQDQQFQVRQLGLMAYNNYDLTDSVKMLETFLKAFNQWRRPEGVDTAMLQGLFKVVETFTAAIGIQFTPSQAELRAKVQEEHDRALPITCFRFAKDSLDCSTSLAEDLQSDILELPGDHLTPVYLRLGLDGAAPNGIPAYEAFASTKWEVGDEENLQSLVDAIVSWLMGTASTAKSEAYRILPNGVIDV